jgi:HSP20 family protein
MKTLMRKMNGNSNLPATSFNGLVDRIFQNDLSHFFDDATWGFNGLSHSVTVPVNIHETDTSYELEVVAPGLKKEDITVNLNGPTLTVSFEQKENSQKGTKESGWIRNEYQQRSFSRSFQLDDSIKADQITAQYKDGILYLQLPKKEEDQALSTTIEIK